MRILLGIITAAAIGANALAATIETKIEGEVNSTSIMPALIAVGTATSSDTVILTINSPGGSMAAGFKLLRAIEQTKAHTVCKLDGLGASMGAILFLGCKEKIVEPGSVLMFHLPYLPLDEKNAPADYKLRDYFVSRYTLTILKEKYNLDRKMGTENWNRLLMGDDVWYFGKEQIDPLIRKR